MMTNLERENFAAYFARRLRSWQTWAIAAIVGTFINLYGLVLVPVLRGMDPVATFIDQVSQSPAVSALTIAIAYAFPVLVSAYSSALANFASRHTESLADFPDRKPDPVFRVDESGLVVDAGKQTSELFREYDVRRAADILGPSVWHELSAAIEKREPTPDGLVAHFEKANRWYLVAHSEGPDGHVNLYLTSIAEDVASRIPGSQNA